MKLRFTICGLLWLLTLAALCVAWWVDRSTLSYQRDAVEEKLRVVDSKLSNAEDREYAARGQLSGLLQMLNRAAERDNNQAIRNVIEGWRKEFSSG